MKLSKFILIICCCIFLPLHSVGQSGCYVSYENKIYFPVIPIVNTALLSNGYPTTCPDGSTTSTPVWFPTGSDGATCTVLLGISVVASGKLRTYTQVNCPIDDYLPILTLLTVGTGAYYIARKKIYVKT